MAALFCWRCQRIRFFLPSLVALSLWQHAIALAVQTDEEARQSLSYQQACEPCDGLTGDWGGHRAKRLQNGVEIRLANTGDLLAVRQGNSDEVTYTNLFEAGFAFDMEKLANLSGGSAYVWAVATHGDDPADLIGSIHAPSNIAAPDAIRLLDAWYEQSAYSDRLGVLVGFYSVDSEFDYKETLGIFAGGGHGTGLDLSETGRNGPSIFPVTSFGARVRYAFSETVKARLAILDGVPGDPNDPTVTAKFKFSSDEGVFTIGELNYELRADNKFRRFGLGAWHYTTKFDDLLDTKPDGSPVTRNGSAGIYGFAEWLAFREPGTTDQGLAFAGRAGVADEDVNQVGAYYGAGLVYRGLFPGRDADSLGFGFSTVVNGGKFRQAQALAGEPVSKHETEWTLVYSAKLTRWLRLQPIFQYYVNPGTDPSAPNARVGGVRIEVLL